MRRLGEDVTAWHSVLLAALLVQPHLPAGTLWPQILETVIAQSSGTRSRPLLQRGAICRPAAKKISYSILAGVASRR